MRPLTTKINTGSEIIRLPGQIPAGEIGFDFDGVIADTADAFLRLACEKYDYCSYTRDDITNFELENCIDIPKELVENIFTDILMDSIQTGLQPMPDAIMVLKNLSAIESVTVVTARPIAEPVLDWFELHGSKHLLKQINVIATGDHNDKVRYLHKHGIKYFIDDRAATCQDLAKEGITPIVFSQPWNHKRHTFNSVTNWSQISRLLSLPATVR